MTLANNHFVSYPKDLPHLFQLRAWGPLCPLRTRWPGHTVLEGMVRCPCYQQQRDRGAIAALNWDQHAGVTSLRASHGLQMLPARCCFWAAEHTTFLHMNACARCQGPPTVSSQEDYAKNANRSECTTRDSALLPLLMYSVRSPINPADLTSPRSH